MPEEAGSLMFTTCLAEKSESRIGRMDDHLALQDLHGAVLFETVSDGLFGTETEGTGQFLFRGLILV
jgi:hypothetical protein